VFFLLFAGQLTKVLAMIKREICARVKGRSHSGSDREMLTTKLNNLIKQHLSMLSYVEIVSMLSCMSFNPRNLAP